MLKRKEEDQKRDGEPIVTINNNLETVGQMRIFLNKENKQL